MNELCTLIIWGGMYYATPQWMEQQIPDEMWSQYTIHILPYTERTLPAHDLETTALIGFSAGGLRVLENYSTEYAFIGLIDPSTRPQYAKSSFNNRVRIMYNERNWGGTNSSLTEVAKRIKECGGSSERVNINHKEIPRAFFISFYGSISSE